MDSDIKDLFNSKTKIKSKNVLYVDNAKQLNSILSSERLSLLLSLQKNLMDISTTAKKLNRKQEAISRDAKILEETGIIKKIKKGKYTYLKSKIKKIEIDFS